MSEWKRVIDELPIIPEGKYGISVLVCTYDSCYDESDEDPKISRGIGLDIDMISFGYLKNKKEVPIEYKTPCFIGWDDEQQKFDRYLEHDPIVFWMYLPKKPKYETIWNEEKNRLEII